FFFFFSSRRRHTRSKRDWSSDVCCSDLVFLAKFNWVDTYAGILAPNFASAFGVFLIRQAIKNIPMDLIDAARIDGAGEVRIVTRSEERRVGKECRERSRLVE